MKTKLNVRKIAELGVAITAIAALVAGCGGGNGGGIGAVTNSLSGIVADGYISGATACLDTNNNGICDAGEPSGSVTNASGVFTITGFTTGDDTKYPVVVQIPSTAVDSDFPASTVGQAFSLTAPVGKTFVSPLTTLVQQKVAAGNTLAAADAAVLQLLGVASGVASGVSATENYMVLQPAGTDQTNAHIRAHAAAQVVAAVFKQGKINLADTAAATNLATQSTLANQAQTVLSLQNQATGASAAALFSGTAVTASSVAPMSTLKAGIAAANVPAATAATQAVTINFDVINGASAVGTTGCSTPITVGTANTTGTLSAAKFYVSNVSLIDSKGGYSPLRLTENTNQGRNVALLNFENGSGTCAALVPPASYTAVVGTVVPAPSGTTYVGIAFTVGVPQYSNYDTSLTPPVLLLNHSDPLAVSTTPAPLQDIGMNWSWQSGRKFARIEFVPTTPGTSAKTMVHLGSTGCLANPSVAGVVATPCGGPNNAPVTFTTGFNTATNKIALDLGSLFGGLDFSTSKTWMSGRVAGMMTASPAYYYDKFQLSLTTGLPINGGITASTPNPLFVIK
jgi:uncharacterized repeat protein (TIGR04052 family)